MAVERVPIEPQQPPRPELYEVDYQGVSAVRRVTEFLGQVVHPARTLREISIGFGADWEQQAAAVVLSSPEHEVVKR